MENLCHPMDYHYPTHFSSGTAYMVSRVASSTQLKAQLSKPRFFAPEAHTSATPASLANPPFIAGSVRGASDEVD